MLIFGHRFILSDSFYHIDSIDDIKDTPSSSILHIEFDESYLEIINFLRDNGITFALSVKNIKELIYASSLGASFILVDNKLSKISNDIANNYLFDAKVLVHIDHEDEIEEIAKIGVDGVIFDNAIVYH